jgi:long-chain acyl-CoA synthetase
MTGDSPTAPDPSIGHLRAVWDELTAPGGGFAMTDTEVDGVPMRVFEAAPATLRAVWELASLHGDKDYVVYEDERFTYAEVDARVRALAHHLRDVHGVGPGHRVALAMRNYPEWVVGHWAILSLGAAVVGMNAWWTTREMAYAISDSQPTVLIADDERLERLRPELDELRRHAPLAVIAVRTTDDLPDGAVAWDDVVRSDEAPAGLPDADIDPGDDALIFYTSGTTGTPKGAQITHRGSVHNIWHLVFWTTVVAMAGMRAAEAAADGDEGGEAAPDQAAPEMPAQPVFMAPTPLFHVTACNCLMHPCTLAGGKLVLTRRWDAGRALELIEREGVTTFSGVPTMSRELLAHPDWDRRDTSTLSGMAGGGAPVQPDLVGRIDKSLAGGAPSTGYGLTETSGIITANSSKTYLAKPSSCGPVMPTLDAKLIDETGADLAPGPDVVGRLCVRGPVVIKGYLNRPEATAESIVDGWFDTGDIARIDDDGFVTIVDRAKDMVLRGGENVYCSEVEAAIYEHDAVAEAAVFAVPDERLGETVGAAIVVREGAELDAPTLQAFLAERIARHKVPDRIWLRDEALPRNASGKFLKRELRAELLDT